jgi:nickel superoxide dismutase
MTRTLLPALALLLLLVGGSRLAAAHCEVPCGVYGDQQRFEAMLEDTTTIHKAMGLIGELAGKPDAQSANQLVRWVNTKESHAKHVMEVIAQYFMAQRIKPSKDKYVEKLTAAHAVMQAAMKCKQTVDPANADALTQAIVAFHKVYEGK